MALYRLLCHLINKAWFFLKLFFDAPEKTSLETFCSSFLCRLMLTWASWHIIQKTEYFSIVNIFSVIQNKSATIDSNKKLQSSSKNVSVITYISHLPMINLILCMSHLIISFFSNNENEYIGINKCGANRYRIMY